MRAALFVARGELRRRWPALLAIAVMFGLAGATVVSAAALHRRTDTVYDRLVAAVGPADAQVAAFYGHSEEVADLPGVEAAWPLDIGVASIDGGNEYIQVAASTEPRPEGLANILPVRGRLPDPAAPDEIVIDERLVAEGTGAAAVGQELELRFLTRDDFRSFDTGFGEPGGPVVPVRVVGTFQLPGTTEDSPPALAGPGFIAAHPDALVSGTTLFLRLDEGRAGVPALRSQLEELAQEIPVPPGAEEFPAFDVVVPADGRAEVTATARVVTTGLLAFAAAVGVAAAVVAVLALLRLYAAGAPAAQTQRSLGMTPRQRAGARTAAMVPSALVAGLLAAGGAALASGLEPMGSLRTLEPSPGQAVNVAVVVLGAAAVAAVLLALSAATAAVADPQRAGRRRPRRSPGVLPVSASPFSVAVRFAQGPTGRPVRSAVLGVAVAVTAVVAGLVFTASLTRLVDTPGRWGWVADAAVIDADAAAAEQILQDPDVAEATRIRESVVRFEGEERGVQGAADLKGSASWTVVDGVLPTAGDEVVLGPRLARQLGVGVGDTVEAGDGMQLEVVGLGLGPTFGTETFGASALMTEDGLAAITEAGAFTTIMMRAAEGVSADSLLATYGGSYEMEVAEAPPPVANLGQLGRLPELLVAFMAVLGLAALANALVVVVRHRRQDLAVLRVLGSTPRQSATTVVVLACLTAAGGLLIGVPVGLALGRTLWRVVAEAVFVAPDPDLQWGAVAVAVAATFLVAAVVAAVPAVRAGRARPAGALRSE